VLTAHRPGRLTHRPRPSRPLMRVAGAADPSPRSERRAWRCGRWPAQCDGAAFL